MAPEFVIDPKRLPSWDQLNVRLNAFITERDGEWCGLPMPLPGCGLVLEDRHPYADKIEEIQRIFDDGRRQTQEPTVRVCHADDMGWLIVNRWRGLSPHGIPGEVVVLRHEDGRTTWGHVPSGPAKNGMLFGPMETFDAWSLETELTAIDRLAELLTERMFRCWVLTGSFLETSKRSGLTYFFRRCRPTVVMTPHGSSSTYFKPSVDGFTGTEMRVLCCLCLHPVGYYRGTFGGAMVPTDDAIAHLLLMRGDEHMLWKRANQHHPVVPESGL